MGAEIFILGIPFGIMLTLVTGPIFLEVVNTTLHKGKTKAILIEIGAVLADLNYIMVSYLFTVSLTQKIKSIETIETIGGIILIIYGRYYYKKKEEIKQIKKEKEKGNYILYYIIKGYVINIVNVSVFIYWTSLVVLLGTYYGLNDNNVIVFFGTILLTYIILGYIKIYIIHYYGKGFSEKQKRGIKKTISHLIILLGAFITSKAIYKYF
tara:strand:+ start:827 stop:1456 length:630 start_codon:yes stop_codon:yes gene_type:complete